MLAAAMTDARQARALFDDDFRPRAWHAAS